MARLSKFEKAILRHLIKRELQHFSSEYAKLTLDAWPESLASAAKYRAALRALLKKLSRARPTP